jgi:hypothetical protein
MMVRQVAVPEARGGDFVFGRDPPVGGELAAGRNPPTGAGRSSDRALSGSYQPTAYPFPP